MVSRCDCIVLAVVGQFFTGGTVVHAVAVRCSCCCWLDHWSFIADRTGLYAFTVGTLVHVVEGEFVACCCCWDCSLLLPVAVAHAIATGAVILLLGLSFKLSFKLLLVDLLLMDLQVNLLFMLLRVGLLLMLSLVGVVGL
jgi:hypothetical protein